MGERKVEREKDAGGGVITTSLQGEWEIARHHLWLFLWFTLPLSGADCPSVRGGQ